MDHILALLTLLFTWVLVTSTGAAILVVLIRLIQLGFRHKLSVSWHYGLWLLLLVKLTLPITWDSPVDVLNDFNLSSVMQEHVFDSKSQMEQAPMHTSMALNSTALESTSSDRVPIITWLACVWAVGMLVMILLTFRSMFTWTSKVNREALPPVTRDIRSAFERTAQRMNIQRTMKLKQTDLVNSPSLFGVFRPVVLLPHKMIGAMKESDYTNVFIHELAHYKRKDVGVNLWASLLLGIHWFNPFIWYALYRMRMDQEIACDSRALQYVGYHGRNAYAETIIRLLEIGVSPAWLPSRVGLTGYRNQIKRRLTMIYSENGQGKRKWLLGFTFAVIVLGAILLGGHNWLSMAEEIEVDSSVPIANKAGDNDPSFIAPVEGTIIHPFGLRQVTRTEKAFHSGVDITNEEGTEVVAMSAGVVTYSDYVKEGYGFTINIQHENAWESQYSHLKELHVQEGDKVERGEVIGLLGSTGKVTGPVLHFSVSKDGHFKDPMPLINVEP